MSRGIKGRPQRDERDHKSLKELYKDLESD